MASRADGPDDDAVEPGADADVPEPDELTDDAQWASIVARLGDLDVSEPDDASDAATADPGPATPGRSVSYPVAPWVQDPSAREPTGRDWDGTDQIDDAESEVDDQEHFVPPDPGPVLGGDPLLTMAWFAVVGMPLFLFVVLIAWRSAPFALIEAAGVVLFLGVAVLLWRMPHRRDENDDDSGARV